MGHSWRFLFITLLGLTGCVPDDLSTPAEPIGETPSWGEGFTAKDQGQKRESLLGGKNVMGGEKSLTGASPKAHANAPEKPLATNPEQGKALYTQHCARCHGAQGYGGQRMGIGVLPPVISPAVKALSAQALTHLIVNGKGRMPPHKNKLDAAAISAVVTYVQSLNP